MMMGVATIPPLCDLERSIERQGLDVQYASRLMDALDAQGIGSQWSGTWMVIALTRLSETQKTQAALRVLGEK